MIFTVGRLARAARSHPQKGHNVNILLTVTAVIELGTGLALLLWPSLPVKLLLGSSLDTPTVLTVGRVAGGSAARPGSRLLARAPRRAEPRSDWAGGRDGAL